MERDEGLATFVRTIARLIAAGLIGAVALGGHAGPRNATINSDHWSGYLATGHRFALVSGTFLVPYVNGSCSQTAVEWVGVGGRGHKLLQSGVAENCKHQVTPWWYELPGHWTARSLSPVSIITQWLGGRPAVMRPLTEVQVTLFEITSSKWSISLTDLTTGGMWTTNVKWAGTAPSAEWVVEDPDQLGTKACTWRPQPRAAYCPMPAFTPILFTNLATSPPIADWARIVMRDRAGRVVASPSPLTEAGFAVTSPPPGRPR